MLPDEKEIACLWDILNAAKLVLTAIEGMDFDAFRNNEIHQAAVIRQFEIIPMVSFYLSFE